MPLFQTFPTIISVGIPRARDCLHWPLDCLSDLKLIGFLFQFSYSSLVSRGRLRASSRTATVLFQATHRVFVFVSEKTVADRIPSVMLSRPEHSRPRPQSQGQGQGRGHPIVRLRELCQCCHASLCGRRQFCLSTIYGNRVHASMTLWGIFS